MDTLFLKQRSLYKLLCFSLLDLAKGAGHKSLGNLTSAETISLVKVNPPQDVPNVDLPIKITLRKDFHTVNRYIEFKLEKMIVLSAIKFAMPKEKFLKTFLFSFVDFSVLFPQEKNTFTFFNQTQIVSSWFLFTHFDQIFSHFRATMSSDWRF